MAYNGTEIAGYYTWDADLSWHRNVQQEEIYWRGSITEVLNSWQDNRESPSQYRIVRAQFIAPYWSNHGGTTDYASNVDGIVIRGRKDRHVLKHIVRNFEMSSLSAWPTKISIFRIIIHED